MSARRRSDSGNLAKHPLGKTYLELLLKKRPNRAKEYESSHRLLLSLLLLLLLLLLADDMRTPRARSVAAPRQKSGEPPLFTTTGIMISSCPTVFTYFYFLLSAVDRPKENVSLLSQLPRGLSDMHDDTVSALCLCSAVCSVHETRAACDSDICNSDDGSPLLAVALFIRQTAVADDRRSRSSRKQFFYQILRPYSSLYEKIYAFYSHSP